MDQNDWNARFKDGSARFATKEDARRIGLFEKTPTAPNFGLIDGLPVYEDGPGAKLVIAPSRAGKGSEIIIPNLLSGVQSICTQIVLNTKADAYHVTKNQVPDDKSVFCWNLDGRDDVPQDKLNPFEGLTWQSRTLESDTKTVTLGLIPDHPSGKDKFFTSGGRSIKETLFYSIAWRDGEVTCPALYEASNAVRMGGEPWKRLSAAMEATDIPLCRRVRAELDAYHADPHGGGGLKDQIGEVTNAMSFASDPNVMRSVSPPFTVSIKDDLCSPDRFANFFIICEADKLQTHAPLVRAAISTLFLTKSRNLSAPIQDWVLDETALLGAFPLASTLAAYGPGFGIRPWFVFQNLQQANLLGPQARQTILANAQTQLYFGSRDFETCSLLSNMLGRETLDVADPLAQSKARQVRDAVTASVLSGGDPFEAALQLRQSSFEARYKRQLGRPLKTPDELRDLLFHKMLMFTDGLPGALILDRKPYWERRSLAGKYLPDPFHPPFDRVKVQTRWGSHWRNVISEPVPEENAHLPQYRDGMWTYVEGFKP